MAQRRAVVLLSGGLDSATCLAIARAQEFECFALSFDYGQRHRVELDCAAKQAEVQGASEHQTISIDLRALGGSALTDDIEVPAAGTEGGIPVTYVPARNTIMLSFALAFAEVRSASHIFIGVNAVDYSGYPDCRPEYIAAFQTMANLATKAALEGMPVTISTPLISLSKADIIQIGLDLGVHFAATSSCYNPSPDGKPCLQCDSCVIRTRAFAELGIEDPLVAKWNS